ncbi:MAG: hypothetical protein ABSE70_05315 [Candidatus Limnocylindrales bacterium]
MRLALAFGAGGFDIVVVALAGFLIRGGIVLLALPSVVLPSVIGIAGVTGVDAFGIDGRPTMWFFEIVTIVIGGVVAWLALASVIGSLIDVWLIEAAVGGTDRPIRRGRPLPGIGLLLDMVAVRGICLLPLAGALAWAGSRIYTAAYDELTTPSNLATPLPVRIVENAADAVILVTVVWLATETIAALAVRRLVLSDDGVRRSLVGALVQIVRRPASTAATVLASTGATVLATALALAATATAFDWCRVAARNQQPIAVALDFGPLSTTRDFRPVVFVLTALVLAIAWVTAAALSGIASAWRSAAWTGEVEASMSNDRIGPAPAELGLSGGPGERSGD